MSIRPYPSQWEIDTTLDSVGPLRIRPIRPQDETLYEDFFAAVTMEDRRLRFFGSGPRITHDSLARFTQIDYAREMAFVAVEEATAKLLGVVRVIADPDYTHGEYAILVRSDLKGRGLGWRLMRHLIDYAKAEGLKELHGAVLAQNSTMLRMCSELGFTVEGDPGDSRLMRVVLDLT
jgi:acetyltransferase